MFVHTSARVLTACSALADLQVAETFMLLQKLRAFSLPNLDSLSVSSCFSSMAFVALWSLQMEASLRPQLQESPTPTGEPLLAQTQRNSRPGQWVLLLELVVDKVSAVLKLSSPVSARDPTVSHSDDTVSPSCGLT